MVINYRVQVSYGQGRSGAIIPNRHEIPKELQNLKKKHRRIIISGKSTLTGLVYLISCVYETIMKQMCYNSPIPNQRYFYGL